MAKTTNRVYVKQGPVGDLYIANIGDVIYNDKIVQIGNRVIPLFENKFFTLPEDKDKYAVVNVYYDITTGDFIFDRLGIYDFHQPFINATAIWNVFPIAQFSLKQEISSFIVANVREFTEMSTYSITDTFNQGVTGLRGPQGYPGSTGIQGYQGITGYSGIMGSTGQGGITGIGSDGEQGIQGTTGSGYDFTYLLDLGFESNRLGVMDRSPYERDCIFKFTGMGGATGWIGATEPVTGIQDSRFIKTVGIIESAHEVIFAGGTSAYERDEFLQFSGALSCWLKVNQRPRALFSSTVDSLEVSFTDESRLFPTEWLWDFGDGFSSLERNPKHLYLSSGSYIVILKVKNENGESYRYGEVIVA